MHYLLRLLLVFLTEVHYCSKRADESMNTKREHNPERNCARNEMKFLHNSSSRLNYDTAAPLDACLITIERGIHPINLLCGPLFEAGPVHAICTVTLGCPVDRPRLLSCSSCAGVCYSLCQAPLC